MVAAGVDASRPTMSPQRLDRLISTTGTELPRISVVEGRGSDLNRAVERLDLEAIVAKRKGDPYAPSTVWLKVKNRALAAAGRGESSTLIRAEASVRHVPPRCLVSSGDFLTPLPRQHLLLRSQPRIWKARLGPARRTTDCGRGPSYI